MFSGSVGNVELTSQSGLAQRASPKALYGGESAAVGSVMAISPLSRRVLAFWEVILNCTCVYTGS